MYPWYQFVNYSFKITATCPRGQWVNVLHVSHDVTCWGRDGFNSIKKSFIASHSSNWLHVLYSFTSTKTHALNLTITQISGCHWVLWEHQLYHYAPGDSAHVIQFTNKIPAVMIVIWLQLTDTKKTTKKPYWHTYCQISNISHTK